MNLPFEGTPYSLDPDSVDHLVKHIREIEESVRLLREHGQLTEKTLFDYYGATRFEQIAESNAIEGSTLSVGETELALLKGVTLTNSDPGHVRDARALAAALDRLSELAQDPSPTDCDQVRQLHTLIMDSRIGAGLWRSEPVRISGSSHRPPKTLKQVDEAMAAWQAWSSANPDAPAVLRAAILHAWLVHVHPFLDGNGRSARAVTTLELVRAGYPPLIIKKTAHRGRYIDALQISDSAGDLGPFLTLILERAEGALVGLRLAAKKHDGYSEFAAKVRERQMAQLSVWNTATALFSQMLAAELGESMEAVGGRSQVRRYETELEFDSFVALCDGVAVSRSWCFEVTIQVPGLDQVRRLAWIGYTSDRMKAAAGLALGPALFWSAPNEHQYPPWRKCSDTETPAFDEMTIVPGRGDVWHVRRGQQHSVMSLTEAVQRVVAGFRGLIA